MKKIMYLLAGLLFFTGVTSCEDRFEEANTNPNKIYNVRLQDVFPGTIYKSLDCMAELNYNYFMWFSRYSFLTFRGPSDKDNTSGAFTKMYVDILKNLQIGIDKEKNIPEAINRVQIAQIWKAYVYYFMASSFGPMPMQDALNADLNEFRYDSEASIYTEVLNMLDDAISKIDLNKDGFEKDPVYYASGNKSDMTRWLKFANTLRLEVAMNTQSAIPERSLQAIQASMGREDLLMSTVEDNMCPKWGTQKDVDVSWYYTRFLKELDTKPNNIDSYPNVNLYFFIWLRSFNDPRLEAYCQKTFDFEDRFEVRDTLFRQSVIEGHELMMDSMIVTYKVPYCPREEYSPVTTGAWEVGTYDGVNKIPSPFSSANVSRDTYSKVAYDLVKMDAFHPILTAADANFLAAEAKIKYGLGAKSAEDYYKAGIIASFDQWGVSGASDYYEQDGVKWNTNGEGIYDYQGIYKVEVNGEGGDENHLEQIWKQRYLADFFNGHAAWTLERRTRVMNYPPYFYASVNNLPEGSKTTYDYIPERLVYPTEELTKNKVQYYKAIDLLQANSPQSSPIYHWGDNFFTLLQFAKTFDTAAGDAKWARGTVVYSSKFAQKWYGKDWDHFLEGVKKEFPAIKDTTEFGKYIDMKVIKQVEFTPYW